MSLSDSIKLIGQKALLIQQELVNVLDDWLTTVNRLEVGKSISNISAMKKIKSYCEINGLSFEVVETEWLAARLEAKK